MASVIRAKLGLLISITDTTTGAAVEEKNVRFFGNGTPIHPEPRGGGSFVLINTERSDFCLEVEAYGYEKASVDVRFEELDDRIPTCVVFLIPSEKNAKGVTVTSIFGNLPYLECLEAVDPTRVICRLSDFNEKKLRMTVIKQAGKMLDMDYGHYGLIQADGKRYEKIIVSETDAESTLILKDTLKMPYTVNSPIARIIFGRVDKEGNYLLRIRDDAAKLPLLVRYVVKGEVFFQQMDLRDPENNTLDLDKAVSGTIEIPKGDEVNGSDSGSGRTM